ncbi:MAG: acyltransferase [Lentimicrobiaceae bacterium]|jgi:phenylacetate-coenzyme A ligase PaaK-like adenylate-forming protein
MDFTAFKDSIFNLQSPFEFNEIALSLFRYQYKNNKIYNRFVDALGISESQVFHPEQIPFLPVSFFKTHKIISGDFSEEVVFESSGTTGMETSRHYVVDASVYQESFSRGLELFYGDLSQYAVFALLPSYLERKNSSLVYMVERMLLKSNRQMGGFFLNDLEALKQQLLEAQRNGLKIMLIGVTFALLDMAENFPVTIPDAIIIETGGMKGRRKELTRMELHEQLCKSFGVGKIHSEYGMTELLSQAWSAGDGIFRCPPWMKVMIADTNDPLSYLETGRTGGINIIDLANFHSCPFISTQDLGRVFEDESFEVLGRFDNSDIRGCSLLTA